MVASREAGEGGRQGSDRMGLRSMKGTLEDTWDRGVAWTFGPRVTLVSAQTAGGVVGPSNLPERVPEGGRGWRYLEEKIFCLLVV